MDFALFKRKHGITKDNWKYLMKKNTLITALLGAILLIGCASEQHQSQNIASTDKETTKAESSLDEDVTNQLICKSRAITGSRFKQKTCMTAEEWKKMSRESSNMVNNQNRKGMLGNPEGG